jgi:hypothetical protein
MTKFTTTQREIQEAQCVNVLSQTLTIAVERNVLSRQMVKFSPKTMPSAQKLRKLGNKEGRNKYTVGSKK